MKKITRILAVAVGVSAALSFAGCQTETVPEGRVGIEFWYEADINTNPTFYELVRTYNDTQGAEDGVYVSPSMINGIGDERNTYEGSCDASVVMITNDEVFKGFAVDGLFVDMSDYLAESNFDTSDIPEAVLNSCRLTVGGSGEKSYAGAGQELLAMPFGTSTSVLFYNKSHFNAVGINVISVAEDELEEYNAANSTSFAPHGYAEYLTAPADGLTASTNLAGQTVFDETPNYLATQAVTVNGNEYAAGEIVSYEDKVNQEGIENMDGLHELPSQYDAVLEFVRLSNATNEEAEPGVPGYGVTPETLTSISAQFMSGTVAMILETYANNINTLNRTIRGQFDMAPLTQYREYVGGSTYQSGSGFAGEHLKVIGATYDGEVYTGELLYENDTPVVGARDVMTRVFQLVIPKNSDPAKYDAAWKFISWAAGEEGQAIMLKTGRWEPNQDTLAYERLAQQGTDINYWAAADASRHGDIGDWAYFESGEWVNDWASDFNSYLRTGSMTITEYLDGNRTAAQAACEATNIVILGRR